MLKNITVYSYLRDSHMELSKGMILYSNYNVEKSLKFKFIEFHNKDLIRVIDYRTGKISTYHIYNLYIQVEYINYVIPVDKTYIRKQKLKNILC